jgi:hypothetical protein
MRDASALPAMTVEECCHLEARSPIGLEYAIAVDG